MSTGPHINLVPPTEKRERNWLPMAVAAGVVLVIAAVIVLVLEHGKSVPGTTPISAAPDPYASSLSVTNLKMSESGNLAGGKVTYLDGHIANKGSRVIYAISMQVLFHSPAHEVTQNDTQTMKIIRTREPYVDVEPLSAVPLKPGDERDFRLIFDTVSPDWDGYLPDLRIVRVEGK